MKMNNFLKKKDKNTKKMTKMEKKSKSLKDCLKQLDK